jgi:tRNA(fMet)-specific endonuclease VapC
MLDTDTASYVIRGRSPGIEAKLREIAPAQLCVSAVTCAELMYGLKRVAAGHRLHVGVRRFLDLVQVMAWGREAAGFYADFRHLLTQEGLPIGDADMMIAAHALAVGAVLVTNNTRHFGRVAGGVAGGLVVENWVG